jgi:hypothetical protein
MEELEKKRQTVEELYSLRNATIEEEEAIRRNIKSSFKDIDAEYLSAMLHPENDNNIVLMIKSGFTKRYDQVISVTTHFLTMNTENFSFNTQNVSFANVDPVRFANEFSMFINSIQNDTIGLRKQIKELEGKKEYLKTIQGQIALEEMKAKEGVVSKDISISGEFTKNLRHGDVIYPIDIMFKGRDYFYPAYYKVKKVNPVNIVIDVLSTNNCYDASSGKNLINAAFENVSITPFNVKESLPTFRDPLDKVKFPLNVVLVAKLMIPLPVLFTSTLFKVTPEIIDVSALLLINIFPIPV